MNVPHPDSQKYCAHPHPAPPILPPMKKPPSPINTERNSSQHNGKNKKPRTDLKTQGRFYRVEDTELENLGRGGRLPTNSEANSPVQFRSDTPGLGEDTEYRLLQNGMSERRQFGTEDQVKKNPFDESEMNREIYDERVDNQKGVMKINLKPHKTSLSTRINKVHSHARNIERIRLDDENNSSLRADALNSSGSNMKNMDLIKKLFTKDLIYQLFDSRKRAIELWSKVPKLLKKQRGEQSSLEIIRERMIFSGRSTHRHQKTQFVIRPHTMIKYLIYMAKLAGLVYNFMYVFYM